MTTERAVEVPWAVRLAEAPCLDVGHAESSYLADLPAPVDGIDWRDVARPELRESYHGDIRTFAFPARYRTVLAVSTLEHVGLACDRYTTPADDPDGDRAALEACYAATEPGGRVLVSVPYGTAADHGWMRQYDAARLGRLLEGFDYRLAVWVKDTEPWRPAEPADRPILCDYDPNGSANAVALVHITKAAP